MRYGGTSEERPLLLFDRPGSRCTRGVEEAVRRRLQDGDISHLIVTSITGKTALRLAQLLSSSGISVVCVTGPPVWDIYNYEKRPQTAIREELERLGVTIVSATPSSFGDTVEYSAARLGGVPASWLVAETLVSIGGYGLKTAIEATLMATDAGAVPPFTEILAVAGTDRGADTAAVVVSTFAACFFSLDPDRRFQVKEILAMPRNKRWYREVFTGGDWRVQERKPTRRARLEAVLK